MKRYKFPGIGFNAIQALEGLEFTKSSLQRLVFICISGILPTEAGTVHVVFRRVRIGAGSMKMVGR